MSGANKFDRARMNPVCGTPPVLEWCEPARLRIDAGYQRGMEEKRSRELIAQIARDWNWDLCQPLVVALRPNGHLYVIDGQHRLSAARRRGDIAELPCVIIRYASTAAEAVSFVAINQKRKPLSKLDLFRAAVAGSNPRAVAIAKALSAAGLSVAPHTNWTAWKPGMVMHIGGIERCWDRHGQATTIAAIDALGQAFAGQVLRYAGTLYRGIVRVCVDEMKGGRFDPARFGRFVAMLQARSQEEWIKAEQRFFSQGDVLFRGQAIEELLRREWRAWTSGRVLAQPEHAPARAQRGEPVTAAKAAGFGLGPGDYKGDEEWAWCSQCDKRRTRPQALTCGSRFCPVRSLA